MTDTATSTTTQVYRVWIKASAQTIWDAITKTEWTEKYGYTGLVDYDLRPGGAMKVRATEQFRAGAEAMGADLPEIIIDGEVLEVDPPRKLVQTWRMLMDETMASQGFTRLTYEIEEGDNGVCCLTLIHDQLDDAPLLAALVRGDMAAEGAGGGHAWVLSDLKTLLETGKSLAS